MSNNINYYDLRLSPHLSFPSSASPPPFPLPLYKNSPSTHTKEVDNPRFPRSTNHRSFVFPVSGNLNSAMVSIRRRKLLGLCTGRNSFLTPLPKFSDNGYNQENRMQNMKPVSVHPMPSSDIHEKKEKSSLHDGTGSFNPSASTPSSEHHIKLFPEVKRRKRHRRKHSENQETCLMRGVYFKNMKWQAAIKVDKKQIHLGTVGSQEEAARLYDRAAFMCGREPNFELPEEEKQELSKFNWDEFLAFTRSAINNKKHRRNGSGSRRKSEPSTVKSNWESEHGANGLSGSEDGAEPDTPGS